MKRFLITLTISIFAILSLYANVTNAEEDDFFRDWQSGKYEFRWMHVPVVCGNSQEVIRYLEDNDFVLDSLSIGREGANKKGDPAYFVSYYLNSKGTESVAAITSPSGNETCMMYRSFDLRSPGTSL